MSDCASWVPPTGQGLPCAPPAYSQWGHRTTPPRRTSSYETGLQLGITLHYVMGEI